MTERIQKVNELIKQEVASIVKKDVDLPTTSLLTITRAKTSVDLKKSTLYFVVLPKSSQKDILQELEINIYHIQKELNKKLHMKPVPKIEFKPDKQAYAEQKVYELLGKK